MSTHQAPSIDTHVPLLAELPKENNDSLVGRADIPPPSLWQHSVRCTHKVTKKPAIVVRVDWGTNMFRAYYPTERGPDGSTGRYSERTEWEHCRDWDVEVTYSPAELERQAARKVLEAEIAQLDADDLAAVAVFCDDPDPAKNLGKLRALQRMGAIATKTTPEVTLAAATETKVEKARK